MQTNGSPESEAYSVRSPISGSSDASAEPVLPRRYFNFKRLEDRVTIKTMYGTIETKEGSVLKLETRTLASNQQMTASGSVVDDKMTLTLDGGGQSQRVTIPWGADVRGPYAAEQSLSRSPIRASRMPAGPCASCCGWPAATPSP